MKFYGNQNETVVETSEGFYLIQSVDFSGEGQYEKLSALPEGLEELNPIICADILVPAEIAE